MDKIIECVKKELIEELLKYVIEEHEKAYIKADLESSDGFYQRGRAYAYGDIRLILSSWVKPDDSYVKFIVEFDER